MPAKAIDEATNILFRNSVARDETVKDISINVCS